MDEEVDDEVGKVMLQSQTVLISLVKRILRFAIDNMHRLIFDDDGNVVWFEAAERLASLTTGNETDEQLKILIIQAIEPFIHTKSYEELDEGIKKLNIGTRMLVSMAISAAKTFLNQRPAYIYELVNDWDGILDAVFRNEYQYLHDVIMNSPNLRKWMQGYVLHKLNINANDYYIYARPKNPPVNRQDAPGQAVQ